ncbi:MAG: T9SS type A sorting domain-containing protein [candidate division Zixibacteria bacterium]|nr:T9SS type A sorting domain-containing protein [candidate division Zixibacteria bacterium]
MSTDNERKVRMKTKALLLSVALILVVTGASSSVWAYSGVISIDTVEAEAGDHIAVPIRLSNNDEPISAVRIPLQVVGPGLLFDSVSIVGSILPSDFFAWVNPESGPSDSAFITLIPNLLGTPSVLTATEGLLATLWVSVAVTAPGGLIGIDSFQIIDSFWHDNGYWVPRNEQILASDTSGMITYFPDFIEGGVIVKSSTAIYDDKDNNLPGSFCLAQNYPNPFNPVTTIEFSIPRSSRVRLEVFNILGQNVVTLVDEHCSAGAYTTEFDASNRPSGIYFYRLTHNEGTETRKMTLVK